MNVAECPRCGKLCQESKPLNPNARPIRWSTVKDGGMCLECTIADFIRCLPAFGDFPKEAMLMPHIQQQIAAVFAAGQSEASIEEINWERLVENWDLPFSKKHKASHY